MTKTSGTITSMKRSMSQVNWEMPRSKAVWRRLLLDGLGHAAQVGVLAGGDTTAVAEPLSTLVPRNAMVVSSMRRVAGALPSRWRLLSTSYFSTGKLSPVSEPWITNRSLAWTMRTSPGSCPRRPAGPRRRDELATAISCGAPPSRSTVAFTEIMALSLAAALSALASWNQLQADAQDDHGHHHDPGPGSPVANEIVASTASRITSGLSMARSPAEGQSPKRRPRRPVPGCVPRTGGYGPFRAVRNHGALSPVWSDER
jgi:hypothetical protein